MGEIPLKTKTNRFNNKNDDLLRLSLTYRKMKTTY